MPPVKPGVVRTIAVQPKTPPPTTASVVRRAVQPVLPVVEVDEELEISQEELAESEVDEEEVLVDEDEEEVIIPAKKAKPEQSTRKPAVPDVQIWDQLLTQFQVSGFALYLKTKLRVRLLPFTNPQHIFIPVTSYYRGAARTKYMAKVWNITEGANIETPDIRGIILSAKTVRAIIAQSVEGWELYDADEGHGISLTKVGAGSQSAVNISVSPRPVKVPENVLEVAGEFDLEAEGENWSAQQATKTNEDEEEPAVEEKEVSLKKRPAGTVQKSKTEAQWG